MEITDRFHKGWLARSKRDVEPFSRDRRGHALPDNRREPRRLAKIPGRRLAGRLKGDLVSHVSIRSFSPTRRRVRSRYKDSGNWI